MWKLMVFGVVVQVVLLMSILDVDVYQEQETARVELNKGTVSPSLIVIYIEGLTPSDVQIARNRSVPILEIMRYTKTYQVSPPVNDTNLWHNYNFTDVSPESVFDGIDLMYVGPSASPYEFNTSLWNFIIVEADNITDYLENNSTENGTVAAPAESYSYESNVFQRGKTIVQLRKMIMENSPEQRPVTFINIGRGSPYEEPLTEDERIWYFTRVYTLIRRASRTSTYMFAVTTSMSVLFPDYYKDDQSAYLMIFKRDHVPSSTETLFNTTLYYDEAYSELKHLTTLASPKVQKIDVKCNYFAVQGNFLEFIAGRLFELQKKYNNLGVFVTVWQIFQLILNALATSDIEIDPLVLSSSFLISALWIAFLSLKTVKLMADSSRKEASSKWLKLIDVICLVLIVVMCVVFKCCGYPCRYSLYFATAFIVFRLFCGEFLSPLKTQMELTGTDKVKIFLQLLILCGVVELLFWSILHRKILIVVFITVACGRLLQGSISVMKFPLIIAFTVATLFISSQYLWHFHSFGLFVNIDVSSAVWIVAGLCSTKFMIKNSKQDIIVMFLCVIEHLLILIFANIFLINGLRFTLDPIKATVVGVNLVLPLFGGPNPTYRLLELAAATSSIYVFFTCNGESFFLFFAFVLSFCSYLMDRATSKKFDGEEDYFINILPAIFHAVLIIVACHVVSPNGGELMMRGYSILNNDSTAEVIASVIFYFLKLGLAVTLLEATFLSSGIKRLALPNLFIVVIILNLISFRAYIQYSMFFYEIGKRYVYMNHVLMHTVAAMSFYVYSFVQVLCNTQLITLFTVRRTTHTPEIQ